MKYLFLARKRGAKVAVVNPLREPGLERYWVPSNVESAMFGTQDDRRVLRRAHRWRRRVRERCAQGAARRGRHRPRVRARPHRRLRRACSPSSSASRSTTSSGSRGRSRADMERFARMYAAAEPRCSCGRWASRSTSTAPTTSPPIVNLGLARGNVGRPGAGLMPIRGHSGVQGGAEMGAYATAFPGGVAITERVGSRARRAVRLPVGDTTGPHRRGDGRSRCPRRDRRPVLVGRQLPRGAARTRVRRRRTRPASRCACTRTSCCRRQMLVGPERHRRAPACRHPLRAARRRHRDHHRTPDRVQPRDRRPPAWARRGASGRSSSTSPATSHPDRAELVSFATGQEIRDEIARVVPLYAGIESLRESGDAIQWGGTRLCEGWNVPHTRRQGALPRASRRPSVEVPAGQLHAEHAPRQAVQHDGARGEGPAHRRDARRAVHGPVRHRRRSVFATAIGWS